MKDDNTSQKTTLFCIAAIICGFINLYFELLPIAFWWFLLPTFFMFISIYTVILIDSTIKDLLKPAITEAVGTAICEAYMQIQLNEEAKGSATPDTQKTFDPELIFAKEGIRRD